MMREQFSRFTMPAAMPPPPYPAKPVQPMSRWLVRMVVDADQAWKVDSHVWAYSSTDAVSRARADFYGAWATQADREHLPLRVLEVLQVAV